MILSYVLAVALSLFIGFTGGHQSRFIGLGYLSMLIPTVSVALTCATRQNEGPLLGWNRFSIRYLPVALFLMPAILQAVMLPVSAATGNLHWQEWLNPGTDGLFHTPESRGWGDLTTAGLIARIAVNALAGVIIVSILALFEEIGWRGWLLSHLVQRIGPRRAVIISSLLWAICHVPFAWAGVQQIEGIPARWTAVIVPVGVFGSGLVIGWLWLQTESIWLVAIAHGALNNWGQYAFKFMAGTGPIGDAWALGAGSLALIALGTARLCLARGGEPSLEQPADPASL